VIGPGTLLGRYAARSVSLMWCDVKGNRDLDRVCTQVRERSPKAILSFRSILGVGKGRSNRIAQIRLNFDISADAPQEA
jgi:hypothetical protein